jgi:DNA-binding transcriptional ArsR family regulator
VATERLIFEGLENHDEELADEVRGRMFVFEDIVTLDDKSVQQVLRQVDSKDLALALKGVRDEVRRKILDNISSRAAENLTEEIEMLGPVRLKAVEEAQGAVVRVIRALEEAGQIVLSRPARSSSTDMAITEPTTTARVIRGAADEIGGHAFGSVADLPAGRRAPRQTGNKAVDAIRSAAWDEGYAAGRSRVAEEGHAEGFELGRSDGRGGTPRRRGHCPRRGTGARSKRPCPCDRRARRPPPPTWSPA